MARGLQALSVLALFCAGYLLVIAIVLNQAADGASTGDRLVIRFADGGTPEALQRIGDAGAVVMRQSGGRGFYLTEVLDPEAPTQLRETGLIFRVPTEPTLSSCLAAMSQ
jgi:hypothetical protein